MEALFRDGVVTQCADVDHAQIAALAMHALVDERGQNWREHRRDDDRGGDLHGGGRGDRRVSRVGEADRFWHGRRISRPGPGA